MTWELVALAPLVFVCSALVDYAHTNYVQAVGESQAHRAARWSVGQWGAATVGFVVAVKVSLWLLPAEMLGLYCGTWLAMRRR